MILLKAYMDESSDEKKQIVQTIAGMVAPKSEWDSITTEWAALLDEYRLPEFHMVDCVNPPKNSVYARYDQLERLRMQARFISVIVKPGPRIAHASTVHLVDYDSQRAGLGNRRAFPPRSAASGPLHDPYFLAFEHSVQELACDKSVSGLPAEERIGFVFDRNKSLEGRASYFFSLLIKQQSPYRDRLADCAFDDSDKILPLQVADVIAYEYRDAMQKRAAGQLARGQFGFFAERFGFGWEITAEQVRNMACEADQDE
jgi:hypothetical protein